MRLRGGVKIEEGGLDRRQVLRHFLREIFTRGILHLHDDPLQLEGRLHHGIVLLEQASEDVVELRGRGTPPGQDIAFLLGVGHLRFILFRELIQRRDQLTTGQVELVQEPLRLDFLLEHRAMRRDHSP